MDINLSSAQLELGGDKTLTKEEAVDYVKNGLGDIIDTFELNPAKVNVKMYTEGDPNDPVQKIDIMLQTKGAVLNQSNHSRNIKRAIDKALPELERQVRKMKEKRRDKPRNAAKRGKQKMQEASEAMMQDFVDGVE